MLLYCTLLHNCAALVDGWAKMMVLRTLIKYQFNNNPLHKSQSKLWINGDYNSIAERLILVGGESCDEEFGG